MEAVRIALLLIAAALACAAMRAQRPELSAGVALAAGAAVGGTGGSDFRNQINNVLGFPGIFRGALDVRAKDINEAM